MCNFPEPRTKRDYLDTIKRFEDRWKECDRIFLHHRKTDDGTRLAAHWEAQRAEASAEKSEYTSAYGHLFHNLPDQ